MRAHGPKAKVLKNTGNTDIVPLYETELLSSWLSRISAHLLTKPESLANYWGVDVGRLDFNPTSQELEKLKTRTGVPVSILRRHSLAQQFPLLLEQEVKTQTWNGWNPRICVKCIAADREVGCEPWIRGFWGTVWATACAKHAWPLQDLFCSSCEFRGYRLSKGRVRLACRLANCATLEPFEGPWRTESRYVHADALTLAFEQEIESALKYQPLGGLSDRGSRPKQFLAIVRILAIELLGFGADVEPPFPPNIAPGQRRSSISYWSSERLDLPELRRFNRMLAECLSDPDRVRFGRQIGETADVATSTRFASKIGFEGLEPNLALLERLGSLRHESVRRLNEIVAAHGDAGAQWLLGHLHCYSDLRAVPRQPFVSLEQRAAVIRSRRFMLVKEPMQEFLE